MLDGSWLATNMATANPALPARLNNRVAFPSALMPTNTTHININSNNIHRICQIPSTHEPI